MRKGCITTTDEASSAILMEENLERGDATQEKLFGVVALYWDKTQVNNILKFHSTKLCTFSAQICSLTSIVGTGRAVKETFSGDGHDMSATHLLDRE